jgi:hypothetical protein
MSKLGAEVYRRALGDEDFCRVIEEVKGEGFIAPHMVPVAEEGENE